ncbi:hypothetical protein F5H01DRAFT_339392 [Linnemannia elongata]|nr:hypothetical protein F5H01DRAFT_339392 [Linnemannia elongata]
MKKRLIFFIIQYTPYFFVVANGSPFPSLSSQLTILSFALPRTNVVLRYLYRLLVFQPKEGKTEGRLSDNDQLILCKE